MTQAQIKPPSIEQASAQARKQADAYAADDGLARSKGATPEQVAARQRVVKLFCGIHFVNEPVEVAQVDYAEPVRTINGQGQDLQNPKSRGFMGLGRKPAYLVSAKFPPKKPEEPIYALEYFPLKK